MGDIGDNPEEIEVMPITKPVRAPRTEPARPSTPAPVPAPAEPVPA